LEQLSQSNKVLPCQHTFCTGCLKDIFKKKKELLCPECRKPVSTAIDSLPPNILANRILESMINSARKDVSKPIEPSKPHQPALPLPRRPSSKPPAPAPLSPDGPLPPETSVHITPQLISNTTTLSNSLPPMVTAGKSPLITNVTTTFTPKLPPAPKLPSTSHQSTPLIQTSLNQNKLSQSQKSNPTLLPQINTQTSTLTPSPSIASINNTIMSSVKQSTNNITNITMPVASSNPIPAAVIPGNLSTNPFIDLINTNNDIDKKKVDTKSITQSLANIQLQQGRKTINAPTKSIVSPVITSVPGPPPSNILTTTNDQNMIQSLPLPARPAPKPPGHKTSEPPQVPDRPKHTLSDPEITKLWQLSPRALIDPPVTPSQIKVENKTPAVSTLSKTSSRTLYRALYEYKATQQDELSLKKGELYLVTEQCNDGWFKGQSLKNGGIGVFPGNHVKLHDKHDKQVAGKKTKTKKEGESTVTEGNLIDLGESGSEVNETDAERLDKLKKIRDTLRHNHQQNLSSQSNSSSGATGTVKNKAERYRCIVAFPASSEYELGLKLGDVISLVKRRDDGWCKGTLHRTGKTGLFPASFVEKL